jgi:hypothetical protein
VCIPCPPPAALQRPVPVTPVARPVPERLSHEASARVHWRSPLPAIPLACGPRTERDPLGFPPGFTPGQAGPSRACRGGDRPQALARGNAVAISDLLWRIHSSRATSRRNALARCPLRLARWKLRNSHQPSSEGTFSFKCRQLEDFVGGSRLRQDHWAHRAARAPLTAKGNGHQNQKRIPARSVTRLSQPLNDRG